MASKSERLSTLKRAISLNIYDGILNGRKVDTVETWLDYFLEEAKTIEGEDGG